MKAEEAVRQAVDECISEGILAEFFKENREEIVEMGIYEFNQEVYDEVLREDGEARGIEIGRSQGIEIGRSQGIEIGKGQGIEIGKGQGIEIGRRQAIENLMDTLHLTAQQAMEALKIPENERIKYMDIKKR
jgi:flagellar biosynthesis/type III secretory pathway protein FliH